MKRQYQIEKQRAVNEFRRLAANENPNIQMNLPMADLVGLLQQGVGHLLREAGLALMKLVMEEEVRYLAGERHQQHAERRAQRWGKEDGYCVIDGQKVPLQRTRLRTKENREQRLGSYELFQRNGPLEQGVWEKMMRGLSTRNYGAVVRDFSNAYGIEVSSGTTHPDDYGKPVLHSSEMDKHSGAWSSNNEKLKAEITTPNGVSIFRMFLENVKANSDFTLTTRLKTPNFVNRMQQ